MHYKPYDKVRTIYRSGWTLHRFRGVHQKTSDAAVAKHSLPLHLRYPSGVTNYFRTETRLLQKCFLRLTIAHSQAPEKYFRRTKYHVMMQIQGRSLAKSISHPQTVPLLAAQLSSIPEQPRVHQEQGSMVK